MRALGRLAPIAFIAPILIGAFAAFSSDLSRSPHTTQANTTGPRMALTVSGAGLTCASPADPTECAGPQGGVFSLSVEVAGAPAEGYVGFQSLVYYGGLIYQAADAGVEVVWPQEALVARVPAAPSAQDRWVGHAAASGTSPPLPASSYTGPVVQLALVCSSSATVALLPYDAAQRPLGAGYRAAAAGGGLGALAPAKAAGTRVLDLDGDGAAEHVPVADVIDITCGGASRTPTITPTPSITRTPTITPTPSATATRAATTTRTPGPSGDVDCSGRVDAIDAALLLQLDAGLVQGLPCGVVGDLNGDGRLNSIDATLVLQFVAGLLAVLPSQR